MDQEGGDTKHETFEKMAKFFTDEAREEYDLYDQNDPRIDKSTGMMPADEEEIWNIELKGLCADQDLKLYCDLMVIFAAKFKGIGLYLMPADVNTIDALNDIEAPDYDEGYGMR